MISLIKETLSYKHNLAEYICIFDQWTNIGLKEDVLNESEHLIERELFKSLKPFILPESTC